MEQELVRREVSDGAILVVTLESAEPIPRPEGGLPGHRGFDVRVSVSITNPGNGDVLFRCSREFWNPAHGGEPRPHEVRLNTAARNIADTLAAVWAAGANNYRLMNGSFMATILEAVPLT